MEDRDAVFHRLREAGNADAVRMLREAPAAEKGFAPVPADVVEYEDAPASIVIPLAYPFRLNGQRIDAVSLRPPVYADLQAVAKGKKSRAEMIAEMAGLPIAFMDALRWPDAKRVISSAIDFASDILGDA